MDRLAVAMALLAAATPGLPPRHFDLDASFVRPGKPGAGGAIAVTFRALDPDVRLNETPAPRLSLDLTQSVLVDRQTPAPSHVPDYDPLTAKYLDLAKPVHFPVAFAPAAPRGVQTVKAAVVYFYCSMREAWCRRGTSDIEVEVTVP